MLPDLQQILGMPGLVFTLEVSGEGVIEKSPLDTWAPCCYALTVMINFYACVWNCDYNYKIIINKQQRKISQILQYEMCFLSLILYK